MNSPIPQEFLEIATTDPARFLTLTRGVSGYDGVLSMARELEQLRRMSDAVSGLRTDTRMCVRRDCYALPPGKHVEQCWIGIARTNALARREVDGQ